MVQVGILIQAGQPKKSLYRIEETLQILGQDTENPILAEVYRLKGDILLMVSPENTAAAESLYLKALNAARKQQTLMFELHAVISLNRLWQQQGKIEQGHQILKETYDKFKEGFETADLIEAKKLLTV